MPHNAALRDEYARLAPVYERRWRRYLAASAGHTLAALAPQPGERILDAGCGSGVLLERIADAVPAVSVTGVDLSRAMLAQAATRGPAHANLEQADVRCLPFTAAAFDAVVLASVLHYVADAGAALAEAGRVLRPGGRLVVTDWCGDAWTMRVLARLLQRRRWARVHLRRPRELFALLEIAGFRGARGERYGAGFPWRLITVAAAKPAGGRA